MGGNRIIVIGASAGGVRALQVLAAQLPAGLPAPILAVQHIGSNPSILPRLLMKNGRLPASHATDGQPIQSGHIYVAPPDCHMLVEQGAIHLVRSPKENHTRPAIDPLFRSAAVSWGPAVIGVLLTGLLDDGTAGLQAIKRCGGIAIVQDPGDAESSSMPSSAIRYVEVDHVVPLTAMGELLTSLAIAPIQPTPTLEAQVVHENDILLGKGNFMEHLEAIARPSTYVCPDCSGSLWELEGTKPKRYRCHTGHGFTLRSLTHAQGEATDMARWSGFRALQEKELLLKSLAGSHREAKDLGEAARLDEEARRIASHAELLRDMIEKVPPTPE